MRYIHYKFNNRIKKALRKAKIFGALAPYQTFLRSIKYNTRYHKARRGINRLSGFRSISIEFCSVCNLKCRYCYLDGKNRPAFLDPAVYEKLLKEICENKKFNVKIMAWPISGDFFLHPGHKEIVKITRRYKEKYPDFSPRIVLNGNMMLMDEGEIDFIFEEGVIDQIICSIDGKDKETYEYMRPHADFEKLIKNMSYLINSNKKNKNRIVLQINNGCDAGCIFKKLDPGLEDIFRQVDNIITWQPEDRNESFHKDAPLYRPGKYFCSSVFKEIVLSASGSIIKCCNDLRESTKYGDFTKDTLESILTSAKRREFLDLMHAGKRCSVAGCEKCSITW